MYLIDSGIQKNAHTAITTGTMPPMRKRICQPYWGTSAADTKPGSAPPSGTSPVAMRPRVARERRGADSMLMAIMLGITPPMPRPATSRSQNICCRLVACAASQVRMPKRSSDSISAVLRP